ncbi:cytochrome P450 [Archangium violaceum]|uniref:Cytochrome P450 n=2 Tax=Archangium violaceum TaxID=83451 RepID=A0A084SXJ5_9BACT|nr:cytochrome P450 [Archangium violaceum]KFA93180.1 hypothetical protein Q664_10845 [Archangium violaceum Cb vi76]
MQPTPIRRTPPGPPPMPLLGEFGSQFRLFSDFIGGLSELQRHGPLVSLARGSGRHILVFAPEYVQQVLGNPGLFLSLEPAKNAPPGSSLRRLWTGLGTTNGEVHKKGRRLMLPAFHKKRVEGYRDDMVSLFQRMLDGWRPGETRDVSANMRRVTLLVVTKVLFGLEDEQECLAHGELLSEWFRLFGSASVQLLQHDWPLLPYRRVMRISERGEAAIRDLIARKRREGGGGNDVLSLLLEARDEDGGSLSDEELVGHITILFIAGHETTANALTWTLFLLDQHPEVHAALVDELQGTLRGEAPALEQLERLPLLDRVIKESMRLLPPVPLSQRVAAAPFEMGGYSFDAGTELIYSPYVTHRMPELYPEPARFLPERWKTLDPPVYAYIPFANGPRRCIGATLAMMELKLALAMMLQRYRLALVPGSRIDREVLITLSPKHGMPMTVHAQDRRFTRAPWRGNVREMLALE